MPALLYEAHLAAPDFEVAGAGVPGVPGFWSGHNGRVAWVATHARAVATDLYVETLDPEAPDRYRVGGDSRALAIRQERIAVRGRDDVVLTVRETQHGPLVEELLPGARPALAVAWGGAQPGDGVAALLRAPLARSAPRTACRTRRTPRTGVRIRVRRRQRPRRPSGGRLVARALDADGTRARARSLALVRLARSLSRSSAAVRGSSATSGFVIAADDALGGGAAIEWWWRSGERAARIETLLREAHERGPIGATALAAILADQRSAAAPARVRALLSGIGDPAALAPEARTVARLLQRVGRDRERRERRCGGLAGAARCR